MKRYIILFVLLYPLHAFALSCVDLNTNVSRYQENTSVRSLQDFLFEKGYLKATPNGYFGVGTFAAVKAYQKANNISQTGTAGPLTRALIKKESCQNTSSKPTTTPTTTTSSKPATTQQVVVVETKPLTNNEIRSKDVEKILTSLATYFTASRGVWPVSVTDKPVEICVSPRITQMNQATATEVTVLTTADSPCKDLVDVSYLVPGVTATVPRDPTLATSSIMTGYAISRGEYGDVTVEAKTPDNKATIKARCNFPLGCKTITRITGEEFGVPFITSLDKTLFLRDATFKSGITLNGRNFSTSGNTLYIQSKSTQKTYEIGTFISTDGKTLLIPATTTTAMFSCGSSCSNALPIGDYSIWISHSGGQSNVQNFSLKGFTTSTISTRANATVLASSTNVKIATISISTSIPVTLSSLTLRSTSTSSQLPGKIVNFKLKDLVSGVTTLSGPPFTFGNIQLPENNTRFYDLYADVRDVLVNESGAITYGGTFLIKDFFSATEMELPMKEFTFSAAPF